MDKEHPSPTPTGYPSAYLSCGYRFGSRNCSMSCLEIHLTFYNFNHLYGTLVGLRHRADVVCTQKNYAASIKASVWTIYNPPTLFCATFGRLISSFFLHNLYYHPFPIFHPCHPLNHTLQTQSHKFPAYEFPYTIVSDENDPAAEFGPAMCGSI
jgi:hypothetical protein